MAAQLCAMLMHMGLHGFRRLVNDYIATPSPVSTNITVQHRQASSCLNVRISMPKQSTVWLYMTYDPRSMPELAYRTSEKGPLDLHFLCQPMGHLTEIAQILSGTTEVKITAINFNI
jgi:hypothetical protein